MSRSGNILPDTASQTAHRGFLRIVWRPIAVPTRWILLDREVCYHYINEACLVENNGNDPFLEDCKSPVQPIWIPHFVWLRWVVTIHLIHWLTAKPMSILGSTGIILWYTVWVSIPSHLFEGQVATPAASRCILFIGRMPRIRTEKLLVLSEEGMPIPFNIPIAQNHN